MPKRKIHFESGDAGNFLVWPLDNQNQLVPYQLELLIRHRPAYLLPCFLRFRSGRPQLCLETGSCQPLDQVSHGKDLNPNRGQAILQELLGDLDDAGDRLLPADHFSLQTDLIFSSRIRN